MPGRSTGNLSPAFFFLETFAVRKNVQLVTEAGRDLQDEPWTQDCLGQFTSRFDRFFFSAESETRLLAGKTMEP
jgi:hypothetical protein